MNTELLSGLGKLPIALVSQIQTLLKAEDVSTKRTYCIACAIEQGEPQLEDGELIQAAQFFLQSRKMSPDFRQYTLEREEFKDGRHKLIIMTFTLPKTPPFRFLFAIKLPKNPLNTLKV